MKKIYLIPITLLILAMICFVSYNLIGSSVGPDGILHEPFYLIPMGLLFLFSGLILGTIISTWKLFNVPNKLDKWLFGIFLGLLILTILYFFASFSYLEKRDEKEINSSMIQKPSREPLDKCKWERIVGKDLELWGQRCDWGQRKSWVSISETLPGILEELQLETGKIVTFRFVQLFELKNQKIEDVIPYLRKNRDWKESDGCKFEKDERRSRAGVTAYVLMPTGKALEKFKKEGSKYPITTTCAGFGLGNSGALWFEIHSSNPKKALFFSNSQEVPLYDEKSIIIK